MLALLTVLITIFFWFIPSVGMDSIACCALAAGCLFIVVPFKAYEPPARKRVLAGCVAFVAAIGAALFFALQDPVERAPLGALAMLAAGGLVLVVWSFAVRNRWSRPQWRDYYDR